MRKLQLPPGNDTQHLKAQIYYFISTKNINMYNKGHESTATIRRGESKI